MSSAFALPPDLVKQVKYHFCPYLQKRSHARHIRAHATIAAAARNKQMKQFLIRYTLTNGTPDAWHDEIAKFISALNNDPDLKGQIGYRVMKTKDDLDYYHIASPADDAAVKTLQGRDFFKLYNERDSRRRRGRGRGVAARTYRRNGTRIINRSAAPPRRRDGAACAMARSR